MGYLGPFRILEHIKTWQLTIQSTKPPLMNQARTRGHRRRHPILWDLFPPGQ